MWKTLAAAALAVMLPAIAWGALDGKSESGLAETTGPVILTVSGNISQANSDHAFNFDRAMLASLGVTTLTTTTVWTTGEVEFEGVLVRDVLNAVGAHGSEVVATALNDYVAALPLAELYRYPVMLALKMNGEYMHIRDKGPV